MTVLVDPPTEVPHRRAILGYGMVLGRTAKYPLLHSTRFHPVSLHSTVFNSAVGH